ncbi:LOW QUALITY PROTEIN: aladin-like [Lytechinus variegatus]|uniref:LOW QUALITY PROTEIN: aladin-like n=1 Tax=Lytechinus variegatus TaxID=7654 RepID=UPI001BB25B3D|nr:LOW QUALITY PROTEIN: aladin-like [Lytechinus variegatus]
MCSLAEGPPPPADGCITVCEENGDLVTIHASNAPVNYTPRIAGFEYPSISTSTETLCSLATDEAAQSAFQPHVDEVSLWKQAWYTCRVHGVTEMLDELSKNDSAPWPITMLACGCRNTVTWANSFRGSLYPHLMLSPDEMINEFSAAKDWEESEIRAFAWHQHTNKCAVAWKDNTVKIFISGSDVVPTLKHRHQRGVSCLAWKPLSATVLAVGCHGCILIWHIDPNSQSTRPTASAAQVLSHNGHAPITCLSWDPRGRLLVSSSPSDTAILVWDVPREACVPLRRAGGGGVALLRYSPDSSKLFASSPSQVFRVWETRTWTCEKWTQLSGRCQSACWSPDGRFLLFCTENEPAIFALNFIHSGSKTGGAESAIKCADVSELAIDCDGQETRVGGLIQDMVWDNSGERLAVLFKGNPETGNAGDLIALFNTRLTPTLQLIPSGFVRGEPGEVPELISFKPNFNRGALLTICWHSGKVTFIPLLFIPSSTMAENGAIPAHFTQKSTPLPQELFSVSNSNK